MDLILLHPAMLWAAGALLAPLLLHLMKRHRREPVPFPSLLLLRRARALSARRVRIENRLLWLLRTLLLAALVGAFCMPVVRFAGLGGLGESVRRDVRLVFDDGAATARRVGASTASDLEREAALAVLDGLREGDRAAVLLTSAGAASPFARPTADLAAVRAALLAARPANSAARLDEALAAAFADSEDADGREREVHLFTDGRARVWPGHPVSGADNARRTACFALFAAGAAGADNAWIESLSLLPAAPAPGRPCRALVRIGRSGVPADVALTVNAAGGPPVTRAMPAGVSVVTIPLGPPSPGPLVVSASLAPDDLPTDDTMSLVTPVRAAPAALVCGPAAETAFLRLALDPFGRGAATRTADGVEALPDDLGETEAVFLVGGDADAARMRRLENFVRAGGVLVVLPGAGEPPPLPDALSPAPVTGTDTLPPDAGAMSVRRGERNDTRFDEVFPAGSPAATLGVHRALRTGRTAPGASVALAFGEGRPLLLRRPCGRGEVFLFTVGADRHWGSMPLAPWFLPLVQRLAAASPAIPRSALAPDAARDPRATLGGLASGDTLEGPAGNIPADGAPAAGIYSRVVGGSRTPVFAVRAAVEDSDLTPASPDELAARAGLRGLRAASDPRDYVELVKSHREGVSLAEPLLWAAFLLALAEWWWSCRLHAARAGTGAPARTRPSP